MNSMSKALCAVSLVALAGCHTYQPVLTGAGTRGWSEDYKDRVGGSYDIFQKAHDQSHEHSLAAVATPPEKELKVPDASQKALIKAPLTEDEAARRMIDTGFAMIHSNCQQFFEEAGGNQGRVNFGRDVFVIAAGLISSAAGLNPRNERSLVALPIITTAAYSGIDAYTARFLFGAENIAEVRGLTFKALTGHQDTWRRKIKTEKLSYSAALAILQENQSYCMPPEILRLVKEAIKEGDVAPARSSAPPDESLSQDGAKSIAEALGLTGSVTEDQAAALYWLFMSHWTTAEHDDAVGRLKELPEEAGVLTDGKLTADWDSADLEKALGGLSAADRRRLEARIELWRFHLRNKPATQAAGAAPPKDEPLNASNVGSVLMEVK